MQANEAFIRHGFSYSTTAIRVDMEMEPCDLVAHVVRSEDPVFERTTELKTYFSSEQILGLETCRLYFQNGKREQTEIYAICALAALRIVINDVETDIKPKLVVDKINEIPERFKTGQYWQTSPSDHTAYKTIKDSSEWRTALANSIEYGRTAEAGQSSLPQQSQAQVPSQAQAAAQVYVPTLPGQIQVIDVFNARCVGRGIEVRTAKPLHFIVPNKARNVIQSSVDFWKYATKLTDRNGPNKNEKSRKDIRKGIAQWLNSTQYSLEIARSVDGFELQRSGKVNTNRVGVYVKLTGVEDSSFNEVKRAKETFPDWPGDPTDWVACSTLRKFSTISQTIKQEGSVSFKRDTSKFERALSLATSAYLDNIDGQLQQLLPIIRPIFVK